MYQRYRHGAPTRRPYRWSENDRRLGPLIVARELPQHGHGFAVELTSGSAFGEGWGGCRARLSIGRLTLIALLPSLLKPGRERRTIRDTDGGLLSFDRWHERRYGFSAAEGCATVFFGLVTNDSKTEQARSWLLPWKQLRLVRHTLHGLRGERLAVLPVDVDYLNGGYDAICAACDACPSMRFTFRDYDGELLTARTYIERRVWHRGSGLFRWLSLVTRPLDRRTLEIAFSGEVGQRKGSWKGGTVAHSIELQPGELHEAGFRRYCAENGLAFEGEA